MTVNISGLDYWKAGKCIPLEDIKYGLLYNFYTISDVRNICNTDWHVPTFEDFKTLILYIDPAAEITVIPGVAQYVDSYIAGGILKETGVVYWEAPNVDASNSVGFNGRGAGWREYEDPALFIDLGALTDVWCSDVVDGYGHMSFYNSDATLVVQLYELALYSYGKNYGMSVRPLRDSTTLSNGETGIYIGNDGKVYRTICIGTQEWLADNLVETLYRDLTAIPEVTDGAAWDALVTGALCAYDNDWNNV
jgi:uncharacterized protein (TIGR02145 family)